MSKSLNREDPVTKYFTNAKQYAEQYLGSSPKSYFFTKRLRIVDELLGDLQGKNILDVGCGPCLAAPLVIDRECRYYGIDISSGMVQYCNREWGSSEYADFTLSKMEELPFSDGSFDVALCLGSLEYSKEQTLVFSELARLLKNDGVLIMSMLNKHSPYWKWNKYIYRSGWMKSIRNIVGNRVEVEPEMNMRSQERILDILERNSFELDRSIYYDLNLWVQPFDRLFSNASLSMVKKLEPYSETNLRNLGTAFIVKASKQPSFVPSKNDERKNQVKSLYEN